jgi:hypothetical protein
LQLSPTELQAGHSFAPPQPILDSVGSSNNWVSFLFIVRGFSSAYWLHWDSCTGVLASHYIAVIKHVLVCVLHSAMLCKELCIVKTCICCMRLHSAITCKELCVVKIWFCCILFTRVIARKELCVVKTCICCMHSTVLLAKSCVL